MLDFIKKLFCNHEYKDVSGEIRVWGESSEYPVKIYRVFVCQKCLKRKKIKY